MFTSSYTDSDTPISIKRKAYKTRPIGSLGIHYNLHIGGK